MPAPYVSPARRAAHTPHVGPMSRQRAAAADNEDHLFAMRNVYTYMDVSSRRMRRLAALTSAALVLTLCAPVGAAGTPILFATVVEGVTIEDLNIRAAAYVARTPAEVSAFASRLRPDDRQLVVRVDYRRYVVVVAFVAGLPMSCYPAEIAHIGRKRNVLVVSAVVSQPYDTCLMAVSTRYHVVKLRRAALRRPVPRRAVLKVAWWDRAT